MGDRFNDTHALSQNRIASKDKSAENIQLWVNFFILPANSGGLERPINLLRKCPSRHHPTIAFAHSLLRAALRPIDLRDFVSPGLPQPLGCNRAASNNHMAMAQMRQVKLLLGYRRYSCDRQPCPSADRHSCISLC